MKTLKLTVVTVLLLFCSTNLFSQVALDTVYKKSGKAMIVKVTEVLPDMIKYIYPNGKDSIIMGIDRDELQKIAFANGAIQTFVETMINPENYANQHKNDLKIDFLAPAFYHTTIVYERSVRPGLSWETGATFVGLGVNPDKYITSSGAILGGGVKFMHTPDFYARGQHYAHILKGGYIRLQGYLGYYETKSNYSSFMNTTQLKDTYTLGGFHIQLGKQYVFDDIFLIDIFAGVGYALVSYTTNQGNGYYYRDYSGDDYNFVFLRAGSPNPISLSGGIRVGILF
jgi:hypothetical protein